MEELIPLIFPKVQPMASLFSLSKVINLSSLSQCRSEVIMIGNDSSGPINEHLRDSGRGFNLQAVRGNRSRSKFRNSSKWTVNSRVRVIKFKHIILRLVINKKRFTLSSKLVIKIIIKYRIFYLVKRRKLHFIKTKRLSLHVKNVQF